MERDLKPLLSPYDFAPIEGKLTLRPTHVQGDAAKARLISAGAPRDVGVLVQDFVTAVLGRDAKDQCRRLERHLVSDTCRDASL